MSVTVTKTIKHHLTLTFEAVTMVTFNPAILTILVFQWLLNQNEIKSSVLCPSCGQHGNS